MPTHTKRLHRRTLSKRRTRKTTCGFGAGQVVPAVVNARRSAGMLRKMLEGSGSYMNSRSDLKPSMIPSICRLVVVQRNASGNREGNLFWARHMRTKTAKGGSPMPKKRRETANGSVRLLDGDNGTALSEEPVLVTGAEMNTDDLLNCT